MGESRLKRKVKKEAGFEKDTRQNSNCGCKYFICIWICIRLLCSSLFLQTRKRDLELVIQSRPEVKFVVRICLDFRFDFKLSFDLTTNWVETMAEWRTHWARSIESCLFFQFSWKDSVNFFWLWNKNSKCEHFTLFVIIVLVAFFCYKEKSYERFENDRKFLK